jgi:phosphate transport system substrate-binding protein
MHRYRISLAALTCALFASFALLVSILNADDVRTVRIVGSKYMFYTLTDLAKWYMEQTPQCEVVVTYSEPHAYLHSITEHTGDAIMTLGKMEDDLKAEAGDMGIHLLEQVVGWGAVVLVTDPQNPIDKLSVEQVRKIFIGQFRNWSELGGLDEPIITMSRDEAVSGTERFFRDSVLQGVPTGQETIRLFDHDIVRAVWKRKGSIADARYTEAVRGKIKGMVKIIAVKEDESSHATVPSPDSIRDQSYPLSAPLVLYSDARTRTPELCRFVDFCGRRGLGKLYAGLGKTE